jgi:DNA-directed RNA polymerase sigma subunit (sigma70/sigma32)
LNFTRIANSLSTIDAFARAHATLADLIKAPDAVDPHAAAEASALQRIVSEALADLTPREQRILRMRFGIGSTADHTLEEIGKEFGVTRSAFVRLKRRHSRNSAIRRARTSSRLSSTTDQLCRSWYSDKRRPKARARQLTRHPV